MTPEQTFLEELYAAFNARNIEWIISMLHPDVKWENGMRGGFFHGREEVREYWRKQFEFIAPHLEPLKFEVDDSGRHIVSNQQVVRDLQGNVLLDKMVRHIFTIKDNLIEVFEIENAVPFTESGLSKDVSDSFNARMLEDE